MPINVNVALSDKTYEILQQIKARGHFRTNADAITFALLVAVESSQLEQLQTGRLTEGKVPPTTSEVITIVREFSEHHTKELTKLRKEVEELKKKVG